MVKEGAQVLAFGAGCGGSLGNYAYMQPFDLEKYGSLVDKGIKPFVSYLKEMSLRLFLPRSKVSLTVASLNLKN